MGAGRPRPATIQDASDACSMKPCAAHPVERSMRVESNRKNVRQVPCMWKGAAAGAAGGLIASWTMNQFQSVWTNVGKKLHVESGQREGASGAQDKPRQDEPSTVKAAEAISTRLFHHDLDAEEKKVAGPAVHYAFGLASGLFYGAVFEAARSKRMAGGAVFGAGLWLIADEVMVPALGFSRPPNEYPASTHIYAFASHAVFGLTLEGARRAIRSMLD